ncbi:hypothetical protein FB451DRAFT_1063870 [Mycena latifolia]|nr:hypothetical protein FB451DRAFT_1063870 [Mycena latifolia]
MFKHSNSVKDDYISHALVEIFQKEGRAIQSILTRNSTTTVTELLKEFSMDELGEQLEVATLTLWAALAMLSAPVFTTICTLISILQSQRANNFQLVIGLFLLGSGTLKREIEVLAHAGLSILYKSIIEHVKKLSTEGLANIREVVKSCMVQIVWDNLNIAFKVAAQRLKAKNHVSNGVTATIIPVFDPL